MELNGLVTGRRKLTDQSVDQQLIPIYTALGRGDVGKGKRIKERMPCNNAIGDDLARNSVVVKNEPFFQMSDVCRVLYSGAKMEEAVKLVEVAQVTLTEARAELRKLSNDVKSLGDVTIPKMAEHVERLRSARMSATSEIQQSLSSLRELRKFFLETSYDVEVERLSRFVKLCKELKQLQDDGTLEAISDVAIKMAVKEV